MTILFGPHHNDGYSGGENQQVEGDQGQWGGHGRRQGVIGQVQDAASENFEGDTHDVYGDVGPSGAEEDVARYRNLADAAGSRQGPQSDYSAGNFQAAQGVASRQGQAGALALMRQQATGQAPSAASMSMFQGNDQSTQGQLAAMAGARPGSAVAGQQAAGLASMQQTQNIGHAGAARANEISGAQGGLFGGYQDMRNSDLGAMRMQDARSQHMANVIMQQRGMNQQQRMGLEGMGLGVENAQMDAYAEAQAEAQRRRTQQGNLNQQSAQNADNMQDFIVGSTSKAASGGLSGYASTGKS